jgi:type IV pilus assembly protein PilX
MDEQVMPRPRSNAHGAVLIIGLIVLLVMTLLGVTAMQQAVLQERLAGNLRQANLALQAAEAGLQAGITHLERRRAAPIPDDTGTDHVWRACAAGFELDSDDSACNRYLSLLADWQDGSSTPSQGKVFTVFDASDLSVQALDGVIAQPRVYIESRYLPPPDVEDATAGKGPHHYVVTAVGYGQSPRAMAILQSTITKVYRY